MTTATRRLEFDAGHRVLGHGGKCKHLHGHRYRAEITVQAKELDDLGMVVDFGDIKAKVGQWIDTYWDHGMILHPDDPLFELDWRARERIAGKTYELTNGHEPANPTAENMAEHLFVLSRDLLEGFDIVRVRLYETPNCWADYTG